MYVKYAHCIYEGEKVTVVVRHGDGETLVAFPRPSLWNHRKCAERAVEKLGMHPALDFHYGWEIRD